MSLKFEETNLTKFVNLKSAVWLMNESKLCFTNYYNIFCDLILFLGHKILWFDMCGLWS